MPGREAPCLELGSAPRTPSIIASPSPSEISSASSPEPPNVRATPLFRALAMPPPDPEQPPGQDELERRLPGYRRIVIPRELTLIELLKECSGVTTDEEVLRIREAKLRVVAERVGLRRLHVLVPRLRSLTLDGSALLSLRELGIGLDHLKILSVNRCGLTSLDGVWGVGQLRELHTAGNHIRDLHPLAVLQKLHTLNLSNNPITVASRVWTLGVCSSLRRLFLNGTSFSQTSDYRSTIASTLPMLTSLDDQPLHTDVNNEEYAEHLDDSSGSESDQEILEIQKEPETSTDFEIAGTSSQSQLLEKSQEECMSICLTEIPRSVVQRRRPATTENGGCRPARVSLPRRPRTALPRPAIDAPTRLQIMNTLMDAEWRSSGSKLTSKGAVCGNLAHALRRPAHSTQEESGLNTEKQIDTVERTMSDACRVVAAEIPRAPTHEAWLKFTAETGIEIDINFNERPQSVDPSKALDRLERIERETSERLKEAANTDPWMLNAFKMSISSAHYWRETEQLSSISNTHSDVESVFSDNGVNTLDY